jgi:hypothetical protein
MRVWGGTVLVVMLELLPSLGFAEEAERPIVELVGFEKLPLDGACKSAVVQRLEELAYRVREPSAVADFENLPPSDQRAILRNEANAGGLRLQVARTAADVDEWRFTFVDGDKPTVETSVFTDTDGCRRALTRLTSHAHSRSTDLTTQTLQSTLPPVSALGEAPAETATQRPITQPAAHSDAAAAASSSDSVEPADSEWSKWHFAFEVGYRNTAQSEDGNYYSPVSSSATVDEYYTSWVEGNSLMLSGAALRAMSDKLSFIILAGFARTDWSDEEENSLKVQTTEVGLILRGGIRYRFARCISAEAQLELMPLPDLRRGGISLGALLEVMPHLELGGRIGAQAENGSGADDDYEYDWSATGGVVDGFVRYSF